MKKIVVIALAASSVLLCVPTLEAQTNSGPAIEVFQDMTKPVPMVPKATVVTGVFPSMIGTMSKPSFPVKTGTFPPVVLRNSGQDGAIAARKGGLVLFGYFSPCMEDVPGSVCVGYQLHH